MSDGEHFASQTDQISASLTSATETSVSEAISEPSILQSVSAFLQSTVDTNTTNDAVSGQSCCDASLSSTVHVIVDEWYAYQVFVRYGKNNSIMFATAIADTSNNYNPCLVPFAVSFLQDPTAWHERFR